MSLAVVLIVPILSLPLALLYSVRQTTVDPKTWSRQRGSAPINSLNARFGGRPQFTTMAHR